MVNMVVNRLLLRCLDRDASCLSICLALQRSCMPLITLACWLQRTGAWLEVAGLSVQKGKLARQVRSAQH